MTALKASDVRRKLTSAEDLPPVILVFGPDRGLVTEVSDTVLRLFGSAVDDPFAVVKLDAATVTADPVRLVDEARTVSLFGGRRLIVVRDGAGRNLEPALAPLLADPPTDAVVVVEAGDLKRTGLRKTVEGHRVALAISCPSDGVRDLERMVDEVAAEFSLSVEPDARALLAQQLGGDRAASRSEAVKACLHAAGSGTLSVADVEAVCGELAVSGAAEAVDAAYLGHIEQLETVLRRVLRDGSTAVQVLMVGQWSAHAIEAASHSVGRGDSPARAVEAMRPPVYGARKAAMGRILDRWGSLECRHASEAFAEAVWLTRIRPHIAVSVVRQTLFAVARKEFPPRPLPAGADAMRDLMWQRRVVR